MRFGVEFEMIIYHTNTTLYNVLIKNFQSHGWDIGTDMSIRSENDVSSSKCWIDVVKLEIRTSIQYSVEKFFTEVDAIFMKPYITINETTDATQIRIDFNYSTGTHIHWSNDVKMSNMLRKFTHERVLGHLFSGTPEITFFRNNYILSKMFDYIKENCKYESIKKDFIRNYSQAINPKDLGENLNRKGPCISVDDKRKGTVEFRLFNLHGIKTVEFKDALEHQLQLMSEAVLIGYQTYYNEVLKNYFYTIIELYEDTLNDFSVKQKTVKEVDKFQIPTAIVAKLKKRKTSDTNISSNKERQYDAVEELPVGDFVLDRNVQYISNINGRVIARIDEQGRTVPYFTWNRRI